MKFGDNLKKIRKIKKMSQEELASRVNVSRQSVSKWENGDAYPEMNNILELCKIFNCKINDLVHTDMSDISSLDENIVMSVVKFNEEKQKKVKSLSNVIELIGKIGGIVLKVAIPFVILMMVLVPYIINSIEVKDNSIHFNNSNIELLEDNSLKVFNFVLIDGLPIDELVNILDKNSKYEIIGYFEAGFIFLLVDLIIMIIILKYVRKLFANIKNNNTPFILDNVKYIKKISYLMIALIMINPISGTLFGTILGVEDTSGGIELVSILEILIIFCMSYIFEYGYEIQKDSNGKMYNS